MNGWQIFLTAWFAVLAIAGVARIGKTFEPTKPRTAAICIVIYAGLIYCVVRA